MARRVPLIALTAATLVAVGGCGSAAPEEVAIPAPTPTPPAPPTRTATPTAARTPARPPPPATLVRDVRVLGDGEIVITLTPDGLAHARGRDGARHVARHVARGHAPLRPWAVPHLSGEIRAHALAHASGVGGEVSRRANPVNVELGDYREGVGDGRWSPLG